MVSWFRYYFEFWRVFSDENAPDEHLLATNAQAAFLTVKSLDDLVKWTEVHGDVPGVFLTARNKVGRDGKRKVDVIHQLSLLPRGGGRGDDYLIGILQLGGGSQMSGILLKDLVADLVPVAAKRSGTRGGAGGGKDSTTIYVPLLGSLMEKGEKLFGKGFVPSVGENCMTSEDIAGRPSVIFVPFYFLRILICTGINPHMGQDNEAEGD